MADGDIQGAKGGDKKQRTPVEAPDSLHSIAYARIIDVISEGEIVGPVDGLKSIYYNNTPVQNADDSFNFQNIQIDFRSGTQHQSPVPGFDATENEIGVSVELRADQPWTQQLNNTQLTAIRVRLSTPTLARMNTTTGDTNGDSVRYEIDLSTDGSAFSTVLSTAITGKTTSKYERSHRIDLPKASSGWIIRVRRLTPDSTQSALQNQTYIESYTELIDAKLRYPNTAYFASVFDAAQFQAVPTRSHRTRGRIIKVPSNYDAETRAYTGIWDGTFQPAYTNNPAWVFYDLITHERYGLGKYVNENGINKWALYEIARWCDELVPNGVGGMEPRMTCNVFLQTQEEAYKVLQDLAGTFRGVAYWAGGSILASADKPSDPVYLYTPANVVGGKFEYSSSGKAARHTVAKVWWSDQSNNGRRAPEVYEDEEGIARYGINEIEVNAIGCTSQGQAHRHAKMLVTTERLEKDIVVFTTGLEGTVAAPGQVIQIADPLRAGRRMGGRIVSAAANSIVVDKLPDPLPANGSTLSVISGGTNVEEKIISAIDPDTRTITVTTSFTFSPVAQSVWAIDAPDLSLQTFRVLAVSELDDLKFQITALQHEPSKYDYVDYGTSIDRQPVTDVSLADIIGTITITKYNRITNYTTETVLAADWMRPENAITYEVQWRKDDGEWSPIERQSDSHYEIPNVKPGKYQFRIAALNVMGEPSLVKYSDVFEVVDDQNAPIIIEQIRDGLDQSIQDLVNLQEQLDQEILERTQQNLLLAQEQAELAASIAGLKEAIGALDYDPAVTYEPDQVVRYNGRLYQAIAQTLGNDPTDTNFWKDIGEYSSLADAIGGLSQQISNLTTQIENNETQISILTQNLTAVQTALAGKVDATAFNALQSTVNQIDGEVSANSTAITHVETSLKDWNLAPNPAFDVNTNLWQEAFSGWQNKTAGRDFGGAAWIPANSHAFGVTNAGTTTAEQAYAIYPVPIKGGQRYCVSIYMANHRCQGYIRVWWLNSNNDRVGGSHISNLVSASGGTDFSNWARPYVIATAPPDATQIYVEFWATGGSDPYWWFTRLQIEMATSTQTSPSAWVTYSPGVVSATEMLKTEVDTLSGKFNARHTVLLDVNGNISGTVSENNGTNSSFSVMANVFRVLTGSAASGMEWQANYIRIYGSGFQYIMGTGFGANGDLVQWFGANIGVGACTTDNCVSSMTVAGQSVKRGADASGSMEITNTRIQTFDSNKTLRVRLGRLT